MSFTKLKAACCRPTSADGRRALDLLQEIVDITDSDDHRPLEDAVERARELLLEFNKRKGRK